MMKRIYILALILSVLVLTSCTQDLNKKANKIHDDIVSIDTHADTPLNFLEPDFDIGKWNDFEETGTRVDFPRMKAGRIDAIFMAVFVGQGSRTEEGNLKAKNRALEIFNALHEKVSLYPEQAEIALRSDDIYRIKKSGKTSVYIGIENGYTIGNDLNLMALF